MREQSTNWLDSLWYFPILFLIYFFIFLPSLLSVWVLLCLCLAFVSSSDQSIRHGHSMDREERKNENGICRARAFFIINFTHHQLKTALHIHIKKNDGFFSFFLLFMFAHINLHIEVTNEEGLNDDNWIVSLT